MLAGYGTFASLAGITDFSDKSAAAAGLPPVDSVPLWPYLSGAQPHSPRTVVELGSCATSDKGDDAFCGKRGTNTTVQGLIKDERQTGSGGLWKVLIGSVWQAGWTGPEFPNNTKNSAGHIPDYNDFSFNCSALPGGGCLFELSVDPTEHNEIGAAKPDKLRALLGEVAAAQGTVFSPDRGLVDKRACEAATGRYNGFWGPWIGLPTAAGESKDGK